MIDGIAERLHLNTDDASQLALPGRHASEHVAPGAAPRHPRPAAAHRVRQARRDARQPQEALPADLRRHARRRAEDLEQLARHAARASCISGRSTSSSAKPSSRRTTRSASSASSSASPRPPTGRPTATACRPSCATCRTATSWARRRTASCITCSWCQPRRRAVDHRGEALSRNASSASSPSSPATARACSR